MREMRCSAYPMDAKPGRIGYDTNRPMFRAMAAAMLRAASAGIGTKIRIKCNAQDEVHNRVADKNIDKGFALQGPDRRVLLYQLADG